MLFHQSIARRTALTSLALLAMLTVGSPSFAHAILEDSIPTLDGTVKAGPLNVRLRFNSRIDHGRSRLTLTAPDGNRTTVPMGSDDAPDIITAKLDLTPGAYVLRWLVLAVDGHITRGDVAFTVTGP